MFAQHVLAVLKPDGLGATVMPHGVLFRGGAEKEIRTGIIEAGPAGGGDWPGAQPVLRHRHPGLHSGPARHRPAAADRRGRVLFINADREFTAGPGAELPRPPARGEDRLPPTTTTATSPASPGVVDIAELADNDFNLNIRRYVDNTPPPEPQDVRAHLLGGVPKAEVRAHEGQFAAYGIDVHSLFTERDGRYYDFPPAGWQKAADQIPALAAPREAELHEAFDDWWRRHVKHIIELPDTQQVMETRKDLLDSFVTALEPLGVLDRFQLAGVIASWWGDVQYDIRTLAFHASAASSKAG